MDIDVYTDLDELVSRQSIAPTEGEKARIKEWLFTFYKETGYDGDIPERVNKIIEASLEGWERAPKTFLSRVKVRLGGKAYSSWAKRRDEINKKKSLENEGYSAEQIIEILARERFDKKDKKKLVQDLHIEAEPENTVVYGSSIFDFLSPEEKKFWRKREFEYRNEFEFNTSSDLVLLEEVIYNEILIRRLRIAKITGENLDKVKGLSEKDLIDNHRTASDKLGILRVQRIQLDQNIEGNVSEISVLLDEKLNKIKELKDKKLFRKTITAISEKYKNLTYEEIQDTLEELSLLKEVENMAPLNPLPNVLVSALKEKEKQGEGASTDFIDEVLGG